MGDIGREADQAWRSLARAARAAAWGLDERRAALARSALVWWQGGAAEAYQQAVQDRVGSLALLSARLVRLADLSDELAADVHRAAASDPAIGGVGTGVGGVRMP